MQFERSAHLRLDAQGHLEVSAAGIAFATTTGDILEVSSCGPGTFRLRAGPAGAPDYGIALCESKPCTVEQTRPGAWRIAAGDAALEITESPLSFALLHGGARLLESATDREADGSPRMPPVSRLRRGGQWTAAFALASGEPVYGLGEQFGPLDQRGRIVQSWNADPGGVNTGLTARSVPFAWGTGRGTASRRGAWGLFVHTPGRVSHLVGNPAASHRTYMLIVDDGALDLVLFAAPDPAGVLARYTELTGRAPALPAWSFGLWATRRYKDSPDDAVASAKALRERRIPADVLVLDNRRAWNDEAPFHTQWDAAKFPHAANALAAVKAQGFRVGAWQCPYVATDTPLFASLAHDELLLKGAGGFPYTCAWRGPAGAGSHGGAADGDAGEGWDGASPLPREWGFVDFTNPAAYAWWRRAQEELVAAGIDVAVCDGTEPPPAEARPGNGDTGLRLHNVYSLLHARCVYEAIAAHGRDAGTPAVVWSHAGGAGSQRYPVAAAGAAQSDWEGLAATIRGALSWGMSGGAHRGFDVGGSYGEPPGAELWVRWLQAAVFASHVRLPLRGPTLPWAFGAAAEAVARKWLSFRYRLLPYLQRTAQQASATGLPVMRAMPLAFPGNALVRGFDTQFMCGDALLVAPIIGPDAEVEIALPPGGWYDLNSRQRIAGSRVLRFRATLDQFPVFGREG